MTNRRTVLIALGSMSAALLKAQRQSVNGYVALTGARGSFPQLRGNSYSVCGVLSVGYWPIQAGDSLGAGQATYAVAAVNGNSISLRNFGGSYSVRYLNAEQAAEIVANRNQSGDSQREPDVN